IPSAISSLLHRGHCFCFLQDLFDRTDHVERLLWNIVMLTLDNFLKAFDCVGNLHVLAFEACELLGNEEWLRKESLHLPCASHSKFVVFGEFIDSENCDDVLQILVLL